MLEHQDHPLAASILTDEAKAFLTDLHRAFNGRRLELLAERQKRMQRWDAGEPFDFLPETAEIRGGDWKVASAPEDLNDRRVEITGPCERKMLINALNSGAKLFMADCEDAQSPSWLNQVQGQQNLFDAIRRQIDFTDEAKGKTYALKEQTATLVVRARGWHLPERHVTVDGETMSGSLFDAGLYLFHNAKELLARGSGPYFYLPKLEHYREARLWNDVFNHAQDALGIPRGTIRATCLIETLPAVYQMEEFLYELRDHMAGLNAGRWDYIFSCIKTHRARDVIFPDRAQVTMTVPFMFAYTELLVQACHSHGAHAIGGMAAFIPNRRDPEVTEQALAKVRADKEREAKQGYDGSWVAHPDLVPVAMEVFDQYLGDKPNQKEKLRPDVSVSAGELSDFTVPGGKITEDGLRTNINVGLQYTNAWLLGNGAAAINNLMEDAATAEISRSQVWQWIHKGAKLDDGRPVTQALYEQIRDEELDKLGRESGRLTEAAELFDRLILSDKLEDFLTLEAYERLD